MAFSFERFSLTPALSHWERENYSPKLDTTNNHSISTIRAAIYLLGNLSGLPDARLIFVAAPRPEFHKTFGKFQWGEAVFFVKGVRVPRSQHHPPQSLEVRMPDHRCDEYFPEAAAADFLHDKHVCQPGERGEIRHDARKPNLPPGLKHSKAERVAD